MNIQIFGTKKCFDSKKAERYFKERGIKGMSRGEFNNVKQAVGGTEALIDTSCKDKDLLALINYLSDEDKEEKILENPKLIRTPVVRNGKKATIGYCPEVWKDWE